MEHLDSDIIKSSDIDNSRIINAAVNLEQGQTKYQNSSYVVGSAITQHKKVQQALLELEARNHGHIELQYKLKLCRNNIKRLEHQLKIELEKKSKDEFEVERLEIELEKAKYDETLFMRKDVTYQREISEFCDMVRENMDPEKDIEYYQTTSEEEDRKYWIARMAKQSAVDIHTSGRIGSGNLDAIINMPAEDQLVAIKGAVEHSSLLTAGLEKLQYQILPDVRKLLEENDFKVPELMGTNNFENTNALPEVKTNEKKDKFRIQSSNKSQT